jgi:hypothetical protein
MSASAEFRAEPSDLENAGVTTFVSGMAEKLRAAGTCYVWTDAKAADRAQFMAQLPPQLAPR